MCRVIIKAGPCLLPCDHPPPPASSSSSACSLLADSTGWLFREALTARLSALSAHVPPIPSVLRNCHLTNLSKELHVTSTTNTQQPAIYLNKDTHPYIHYHLSPCHGIFTIKGTVHQLKESKESFGFLISSQSGLRRSLYFLFFFFPPFLLFGDGNRTQKTSPSVGSGGGNPEVNDRIQDTANTKAQ